MAASAFAFGMVARDLDSDADVIEMDEAWGEDVIDVIGNGCVMKEVVREAPEREVDYGRPEVGDQCKIAYEGYVVSSEDENVVVTTAKGHRHLPVGPREAGKKQEKMSHSGYHFTLGSDDEIKGWTDVLETMYQGEVANVTIKPQRAYGKMGAPPDAG